jgi:glycosyltransferase involved in cell wall biosynthesis
MHILEIPSFFPPHGGLFCLDQAKALKGRGHEVRILACVQLGATLDRSFYLKAPAGYWWEEMDGIEVFRHYHRDIPKMVGLNTRLWIRQVQKMFDKYVRQYGAPDIIHAHCCKNAGIAATKIGKTAGCPVFITEHLSKRLFEKDFGTGWTRHRWMKDLIVRAYQDATCVIPVAEELVADLAPFFGKDYRYQAVSNVIDVDFYAYTDRMPTEGRPFRFCCLGNANGASLYLKGYDVLSQSFKQMNGCELHIAGRDTQSAEMKQLFPTHTTLHGEIDKNGVRQLLYDCDALVLPSRSEAQPLVLLEAMSTGIPVVSTEITPQSERIPGACLIAKTGDADSLAEKMRECMDICQSQRFSEAVRAIAAPETVAAQLEEVFLKYSTEER